MRDILSLMHGNQRIGKFMPFPWTLMQSKYWQSLLEFEPRLPIPFSVPKSIMPPVHLSLLMNKFYFINFSSNLLYFIFSHFSSGPLLIFFNWQNLFLSLCLSLSLHVYIWFEIFYFFPFYCKVSISFSPFGFSPTLFLFFYALSQFTWTQTSSRSLLFFMQ